MAMTNPKTSIGGYLALAGSVLLFTATFFGVGEAADAGTQVMRYISALGLFGAGVSGIAGSDGGH